MNDKAPTPIDVEIDALKRQVAALADFVTTLCAALVEDRPLTRLIVEAMTSDDGIRPSNSGPGCGSPEITAASLASDVLTIAGHRPMPSPIRLIHDADHPRSGR